MAASLCDFIVLFMSMSHLVVDSSFGYFPFTMIKCVYRVFLCEHRIAAPVPLCVSSVPFLLETMDARDHRGRPTPKPHVERRGSLIFRRRAASDFTVVSWHLHLFVNLAPRFFAFVHAADFSKTIHKDAKIG